MPGFSRITFSQHAHLPNVGIILSQCCRRWPNIKSTMVRCRIFCWPIDHLLRRHLVTIRLYASAIDASSGDCKRQCRYIITVSMIYSSPNQVILAQT